MIFLFFFFNATTTTEIYTLSLHDALPISQTTTKRPLPSRSSSAIPCPRPRPESRNCLDRKSTRLNSSHMSISYAVFCLKKKKKKQEDIMHIQQKLSNPPNQSDHKTTNTHL